MTYQRWRDEVRRRLVIAGEDADFLLAKADRDLPGLYMAREPPISAARMLHRWRLNPIPVVPNSVMWLSALASIAALWVAWDARKKEAT